MNENTGKVRKNLTASEARNLADTSLASLNEIYKFIRQAASYNKVELEYTFDKTSKKAIEHVVSHLRSYGYGVAYINYNSNPEIKVYDFYENKNNITCILISW